MTLCHREDFVFWNGASYASHQKVLDKLEFGGESPRTMRAQCSDFRYCPDPLGIVTAEQFDILEFGGESPRTMRARCTAFRYCPDPLGIATAEQFDILKLALSSTAPVILSEQSESKDLGRMITFIVELVRRFFDFATFRWLRSE